jgi:hypothetical protein
MAFSSQILPVYLRLKSQLHLSQYATPPANPAYAVGSIASHAHDRSRDVAVAVRMYCVGNTRSAVPQLSPRRI